MDARRSETLRVPFNRPERAHGVLGIDIGTTATRASLMKEEWKGQDDRLPIIIVRPGIRKAPDQFRDCDMPATAFPFETDKRPEDCLGFATDTRRDQLPLKMFMYFQRAQTLREKNKTADLNKILRTIPQVDQFWQVYIQQPPAAQTRIADHLENIFIAHLEMVRAQSETTAKKYGVKISKIAATIPPNWDKWMQEKYEALLSSVMEIHADDITLVFESEAICHFLLRLNTVTKESSQVNRVVLADFGGHTLNVTTVDILRREEDKRFAFYLGNTTCEHGGSELHSSFVKKNIVKHVEVNALAQSKAQKDHLVDSFMHSYRDRIRRNLGKTPFFVSGRRSNRYEEQSINYLIDDKTAAGMYHGSFTRPLRALKSRLRTLSTKPGTTAVVLTGGTFLNENIRNIVMGYIEHFQLQYLPWAEDDAPANGWSSIVSAGAALALTNEISVKRFLSQAVFGVEIRGRRARGRTQVVLDSSGSHRVTKKLMEHHGAEVVITCCPLAPQDNREMLAAKECYELELLGREYKGTHTWELKYEHNPFHVGCQDFLVLKQQSWPKHKPSYTEEQRWPVFYDPGACVLFIDRNHDGSIKGHSHLQHSIEVSEEPRSKRGITKRKRWLRRQANSPERYWQDALCESIETPASENGDEARYPPSQHTIRESTAATIESSLFLQDENDTRPAAQMSRHSVHHSTPETPTKASNSQLPSPVRKVIKRKPLALPNGEVNQKRPRQSSRVANTGSRELRRLSVDSGTNPSSKMSTSRNLGTTTRPIEIFDDDTGIAPLQSSARKRTAETQLEPSSHRRPFAIMAPGPSV